MDPHRLAEERSIEYHRFIAERLAREPEILVMARERVRGWLETGGEPPFYARRWAEVLDRDLPVIQAFLVDRSELAMELRQSTPFAGALPPQERWRIWREVKARLGDNP